MSVSICHKKVAMIEVKIAYAVQRQFLMKKTTKNDIEMKSVNSSQRYHEFQEPLIGLDD